MMRISAVFAGLLLGIGLAPQAGASGVRKPETRDFMLRASAAEADVLVKRHGLQIVAQLPASADGNGRSVMLVRAAQSTVPGELLQAVRSSVPGGASSTLSIEEVVLASVPETGSEVKLEQRTRAILGAVSDRTETQLGPMRLWTAYVRQPAAAMLRLPEAGYSGAGVVAIIDTGVDPDHPVLRGSLVPGYDFTRSQPGNASEWDDLLDQRTRAILGQQSGTPLAGSSGTLLGASASVIMNSSSPPVDPATVPPDFGHGTMVAGVVHRAAPAAKIMPLKAFNANGEASLFDVVQAIYYAADHGAKVVNMSFSVGVFSPELLRAVNYAARKGVTCVASAGNDGQETIVYPAALGNAIGVASTNVRDYLSDFSNHGGDLVKVAAPGEDVITTYPGGGWALVSGTSFSAPWVSGTVALFVDKNHADLLPSRTNYYLSADALIYSLPVHGFGHTRSGNGRLDVKQALDGLERP